MDQRKRWETRTRNSWTRAFRWPWNSRPWASWIRTTLWGHCQTFTNSCSIKLWKSIWSPRRRRRASLCCYWWRSAKFSASASVSSISAIWGFVCILLLQVEPFSSYYYCSSQTNQKILMLSYWSEAVIFLWITNVMKCNGIRCWLQSIQI